MARRRRRQRARRQATPCAETRLDEFAALLAQFRSSCDIPPPLVGGRNLPFLKMTQGAYGSIVTELGQRSPEAAGVLLGPADNEPLVTHFVLDAAGVATSASFTLDAAFLNGVLARYRDCGLTCVGIAHSHPTGIPAPSVGDREYLAQLFRLQNGASRQSFLFPVYCDHQLHPYLARPDEGLPCIVPAALILV